MNKKLWLFIFIVVSVMCGCSVKTDKKERADNKERTDSDMMDYLIEEEISIPDDINEVFDIMIDENGDYLLLGRQLSGYGFLWKSSNDSEWIMEISLPDDLRKSIVNKATFIDQDNVFCTILYNYLDGEDHSYENVNYLVNRKNGFERKMDTTAGEMSNIIYTDEAVLGKSRSGEIHAYDYSSGELIRVYNKSAMQVNDFCIINNKIVAIGIDNVETYDQATGELCETSESLKSFLMKNWQVKNNFASQIYYDDSSSKLYCMSYDSIFMYDTKSGEELQLIQRENCTPCRNAFNPTNIKLIDGTLYISCINHERKAQIFKYKYEPNGIKVKRSSTQVTVYSLDRINAIEEAVNLYNSSQDGTYLIYEYGLNDTDATTRNDAINKLNVELLTGEGPDILVLDGLSVESYIGKGILGDVTQLVDGNLIYNNISEPFMKEDKVFGVPMYFSMMGIHSNSRVVDSVDVFEDLVNSLEELSVENPDSLVIDKWDQFNYIDVLYLSYCQTLLDDGEVNQVTLEQFYKDLKRFNEIADYNWTIGGVTSETKMICDFSYIQLTTNDWSEMLVSMNELEASISGIMGVQDLVNINSNKDREDVEFRYFTRNKSPIFVPSSVLTLNKSSKHKKEAEAFIEYCISEQFYASGQMGSTQFPVNKAALKRKLSDTRDYSRTQRNRQNEDVMLTYYKLTDKEQEEFLDLVSGLTEYSYADLVIKEIVVKHAQDYINGIESLENATNSARKKINIYQKE